MTAASEMGPVSSQMTMSSSDSTRVTPSRVVSFLAIRGPAHDQLARDPVGVEGVHRLTQLQHHAEAGVFRLESQPAVRRTEP